jgi:DNA-binding response OmpR family regulator
VTEAASLAGLRVLVVEDDMLIAVHIEEMLQDLGCIVVGPVGKLDAAMRVADHEVLDAAILDVNIRGGNVFPVAERLRARGIPFALASGYGDWALPETFRNQLRLTKPFTAHELEAQMLLLHRGQGVVERAGTSPP